MGQVNRQISFFQKSVRALSVFLIVAAINCATTQDASPMPSGRNGGQRGIRHVLILAIKSALASPNMQRGSDESLTATLTVVVRISDHSQETNFFGNVRTTVSDFDLTKGSREREIWKDARCHHERGLPKMTVLAVDGVIAAGPRKRLIVAHFRQIGLLLPSDEVMASKRFARGVDNIGPFIVTRTQTKRSRLFVDLKLYILSCDLDGANQLDLKRR
jgi:hypothetical protein